jgi:hypothetical protein
MLRVGRLAITMYEDKSGKAFRLDLLLLTATATTSRPAFWLEYTIPLLLLLTAEFLDLNSTKIDDETTDPVNCG